MTTASAYPALGRVDASRTRPRRSWSAPAAPAGSSRRTISSARRRPPLDFDGHGTHVSGTIGQLTNDGIGTAGVAFNVKLMPVKVLASDWDSSFGSASDAGGTDDDVARGHPLRGRQRREDHQHEPRQLRAARLRDQSEPVGLLAGDRGGDALRRRQGRASSPSPAATSSRTRSASARTRPACSPRSRRASRAPCRWRRSIRAQGARVLLEHRQLHRAGRAGRLRARLRHATASSGSRPSTSTSPTRSCCRRRSIARRGSTCSATSATSARRWRRRTSPASRRC